MPLQLDSKSAPHPFNKNDFHVYFILFDFGVARYSLFNGVYFIDIGSV